MYGFAPVTLMALRRSDPDRVRPYRLKGAAVVAPVAFISASEIIYWTAWPTVEKLLILIAAGLVFGLYHAFGPHADRWPRWPCSPSPCSTSASGSPCHPSGWPNNSSSNPPPRSGWRRRHHGVSWLAAYATRIDATGM